MRVSQVTIPVELDTTQFDEKLQALLKLTKALTTALEEYLNGR